jgi:hypothetical protein
MLKTEPAPKVNALLARLGQPSAAMVFGKAATTAELDRAFVEALRTPADAKPAASELGESSALLQARTIVRHGRARLAQMNHELDVLRQQRDELAKLLTP